MRQKPHGTAPAAGRIANSETKQILKNYRAQLRAINDAANRAINALHRATLKKLRARARTRRKESSK